jgi:alkylation response protein AidB-like acyl-CoA dehydrogenase
MQREHLDWPFFEPRHRELEQALEPWAAAQVRDVHGDDVDADCRRLVRMLGAAGWLSHAVAGRQYGGAADVIDTRSICLLRETLARHNGLADFAFAMQGLGSGAISLAGSEAQKAQWLPKVARGEAISAFALSEPDAAPTWRPCNARRAPRGGTTSSTARRPGSPTAASPTCTWSSRAPARHRARAASAPSSSKPARRASRSPSASR